MGDLGCDDVHRSVLLAALDVGFKFKQSDSVYETRAAATEIRDRIVRSLPREGCTVERLLEQFVIDILPFCKNEASPRFLGFGDTGDDVAALAGEIISIFLQQNLINQSFDAPSATFVEIAVLRWLRELVGLSVGAVSEVSSVWDVGGIITHGGTASNAAAMMLAREQRRPGTMLRGVKDSNQFSVVVPRGIGH
ncbi:MULTISPECIES: pyridoxal-dependent decarboxylase [unclassified Pseudonocardia]|uniref:pyridoxal-dependent decarboxylase n=1 Tax=unclassified Pseudonocardia TaxID=2619320 RepID=UPI00095B77C9|nr:pyridoxal-dependent decarboxylase [Pseudonocardia sp. Ae707_Ps1]OLM20446.1 L-2,4-diaminobutyrate decarboxylase [Pseudonocardia sp. Ae707_Ps1]